MSTVEQQYPVVSSDVEQQAFYESMRAAGECHMIAEMLALQQAPAVNGTDTQFNHGHCNGSQFAHNEKMGEHYRKLYKRHMGGQEPPKGSVYESGLARFPGDPQAWVSTKGDVKRICEQRNLNCTGMVEHQGEAVPRPKPKPLAEDIIQRKAAEYIAQDPGLAEKPAQELREMIIDRHAPKYKHDPNYKPVAKDEQD